MTPIAGNIGSIGSLRNYSTDGLIANVDFNNDYGFAGNTAHDLQRPVVKYRTPGGFVSVVSGSTARPGSISLDGVTDYLIATEGGTGAVSELRGWTSGTIDAWIYLDTSVPGIICSTAGSTLGDPVARGFHLLYTLADVNLRFNFITGTTNAVQNIAGLTGATAQWMNCFARFETIGNDVKSTGIVFRPGGISSYNLITGTTHTLGAAGVTSNNPLAIGRRSTVPQQYLDGQVGSIRVYNRLLSQSEMEFNYNRSKTRYGHT